MSVASALKTLGEYRTRHSRASQDIFEKGFYILEQTSLQKLGDEAWPFLEQFALAALDIGRSDVADDCIRELNDQFPDSPRVNILTGIRMEATETAETCLRYYDEIQDAESPNPTIWKRRISILRRTGKMEKAVEELCQLLDTFYNDVEGWVELADMYSACNQYTSALQSLSHVLLLAPQNPFYFLQFAETAHSADDITLALKMFLLVVDMCDRDLPTAAKDSVPTGLSVRAWWGVKLCARQLLSSRSSFKSASDTPVPKDIELIDRLATERVLTSYSSPEKGKAPAGRDIVLSFMKAS
ncbi:hypothetical protein BD626DRAFT_484099 [Schizophyllum amplum]|uniref:ER membrane protein complex subunit 2 n=1 Tax=Schizophyllum amplum TaxID=97359 RepID=A0A550CQ40_9AGAR|nr:hypothetical protein BD626DRAFT_484099 [Auriculariopsis ampla]